MSEYQHVRGIAEVARALREYPVKVEKRVVRRALSTGLRVLRDIARGDAPVRTGKLRKTIRVFSKVNFGVVRATLMSGNRSKGVFYAEMVGKGTKPHAISARKRGGRVLAFAVGGRVLFRRSIQHPGAKPNDYMEGARNAVPQALTVVRGTALEAVEELNREIGAN